MHTVQLIRQINLRTHIYRHSFNPNNLDQYKLDNNFKIDSQVTNILIII